MATCVAVGTLEIGPAHRFAESMHQLQIDEIFLNRIALSREPVTSLSRLNFGNQMAKYLARTHSKVQNGVSLFYTSYSPRSV